MNLNKLKSEYEDAHVRMSNALLYPETRAQVHEALTGQTVEACDSMLYVVSNGWEVLQSLGGQTAAEYYLAARRQEYENAYSAYDKLLSEQLAASCQPLDSGVA